MLQLALGGETQRKGLGFGKERDTLFYFRRRRSPTFGSFNSGHDTSKTPPKRRFIEKR